MSISVGRSRDRVTLYVVLYMCLLKVCWCEALCGVDLNGLPGEKVPLTTANAKDVADPLAVASGTVALNVHWIVFPLM